MDRKLALRAALAVVLLCVLYAAGLPLHYVLLMGVLMAALLALRGPIYKKIEAAIEKAAPSTATWPSWARKALVLAAFIVAYAILKQAIYWLIGLAGFDVQVEMVAAMTPAP